MNTWIVMLLCSSLLQAGTGVLKVRIFDAGHKVVPARVNVIGADSAFYEPDPAANSLSEFSLKRKGARANVGPLRYYGSFFYTDGSFEVSAPAGIARIEVRKGYGYYTSIAEVEVVAGKTTNRDIVLERVIDMPQHGWHSMDTHLHFDRAEATADHRIAQLLAAEDIELGHILTVQSAKGYGRKSLYEEPPYAMASGREFTVQGLGHINLLIPDEIVVPLPDSTLAARYDRAIAARGAVQHDHAGYGQEIYADVVLGKSDVVELLQFGLYRPQIGLDGYYVLLNSGFRYPLAGGSDYPVCRTMSDSRTFVADGSKTSFATATGRLLRGESFATSGPLLFLSVDGKGPGADIEFKGGSARNVMVQVKAATGDLPIDALEIVQDGKVVAQWHGEPVFQKELKTSLRVSAGSWVAARCSGPDTVHAHTNPVWIYVDGHAPFQQEAAAELSNKIRAFEGTKIGPEAVKVARAAEDKLQQGPPPLPSASQRFPVGPSSATLFPPVRPKPRPVAKAAIEGTVVGNMGQPIEGVEVSARGLSPAARTDSAGRFVLRGVDINSALFLRVSKTGHVTTNTSYLNPHSPKEKLRILLLTNDELHALTPEASRAIVLVASAVRGLKLTASPPAQFTYRDAGPIQAVGAVQIKYQPSFPPQADDREPNLIVMANAPAKDLVLPLFAGQVSYGVVFE